MLRVVNTCLPILLMVMIGMICRKYRVLSDSGVAGLKKFALNITLPALMFSAFAKINYTYKNILIVLVMFLICALGLVLGKLFGKAFRINSRFVPYVATGFEIGMIGYALFAVLYPTESRGNIAAIDIGATIFIQSLYRALLSREKRTETSDGRKVAAEIFRSPVVIGILAGIFLGASGLYALMAPSGAASVLDTCTDFIGAPTSAVILLTLGYDLVFSDVPWAEVSKTVAARMLSAAVLRVLIGLVFNGLGLGEYAHALNVIFILPPAFILPIFADDEKDAAYIASCLSVYTVITIFAFVVLAVIG